MKILTWLLTALTALELASALALWLGVLVTGGVEQVVVVGLAVFASVWGALMIWVTREMRRTFHLAG